MPRLTSDGPKKEGACVRRELFVRCVEVAVPVLGDVCPQPPVLDEGPGAVLGEGCGGRLLLKDALDGVLGGGRDGIEAADFLSGLPPGGDVAGPEAVGGGAVYYVRAAGEGNDAGVGPLRRRGPFGHSTTVGGR